MEKKLSFLIFITLFVVSNGFGIKDIVDFLLGGGYGHYPNSPGYYPGNNPGYPGHYPGQHGPVGPPGPPGAHPNCPLCDSSVYSYCSYKQAHDSCCCDHSGYQSSYCRKYDCNYIYAQSCEEYGLISNCCCVDLLKNAVDTPIVA